MEIKHSFLVHLQAGQVVSFERLFGVYNLLVEMKLQMLHNLELCMAFFIFARKIKRK